MMKTHAALSIVALALCACSQGTAVEVSVSAGAGQTLTVDHLSVKATIGSATRTLNVPLAHKSFPPAHTFVIDVGDNYAGTITLVVDAETAANDLVASGTGSATLAHGKTVSLDIDLGAGPTPDGGADGPTNDDMELPCGSEVASCNAATATLTTTCGTSGKVTSSVACPVGCMPDGGVLDVDAGTGARCAEIVPTAPVMVTDVYASDVTAMTTLPTGTVVFDTLTGKISTATTTIRAPNPSAPPPVTPGMRAVDAASGIGFRIAVIDVNHSLAIWSFQSLTVPAGTTTYFVNGNAVALAVNGDASIAGTVSLQAFDSGTTIVCPAEIIQSPGGEYNNNGSANPVWPGQGGLGNSGETDISGNITDYWGGGGGGGYGAPGGTGGFTSGTNNGSAAGPAYGNDTLSPIVGGSAGGWAINESPTNSGSPGGALQLVSGNSITVKGVINAGGCGGTHSGSSTGANGGGSGGGILLETPALTVTATGVLAVNGGGGAAGGCATDGQNGQPSATAATGGACLPANGVPGGAGGANATPMGGDGAESAKISVTVYGSGGGGGVGRMRFNVANSPTLSTAVISPPPGSVYTTQGTLTTQ
jgi:hypothetical protein